MLERFDGAVHQTQEGGAPLQSRRAHLQRRLDVAHRKVGSAGIAADREGVILRAQIARADGRARQRDKWRQRFPIAQLFRGDRAVRGILGRRRLQVAREHQVVRGAVVAVAMGHRADDAELVQLARQPRQPIGEADAGELRGDGAEVAADLWGCVRLRIERVDLAHSASQPEKNDSIGAGGTAALGACFLQAEPVAQAKAQRRQRAHVQTVSAADAIAVAVQTGGDFQHVASLRAFRHSGPDGIHRDEQDQQDTESRTMSGYPVHPGHPVHPVNSGTLERLNASFQ